MYSSIVSMLLALRKNVFVSHWNIFKEVWEKLCLYGDVWTKFKHFEFTWMLKTFKYLGLLLTNKNLFQEEIKCRPKAGNSCYYSVQTLRLLDLSLRIWKLKYMKHQFYLLCYVYGCESWSLTLNEQHRLRVIENMSLSRIFGPKRDANGEWRWLHIEDVYSFYRSPNIARGIRSRRLRWAGHVARMEEGRNTFKIFLR